MLKILNSLIILITWFFLHQSAYAHQVSTLLLSFENTADGWHADIALDATLAFPELRDDEAAVQPPRQWLLDMSPEKHEVLKFGAEAFLRELITFSYGEEVLNYEIRFPDYEETPARFPKLLNGGAYVGVQLSGQLAAAKPNMLGMFKIHVSPGKRPDVIVAMASNDEQPHYLTIRPGDAAVLFTHAEDGSHDETAGGLTALVWLGYQHVIPQGLDHVLFILAIFLMTRWWRSLVLQSLVFTFAHSITLGLLVSGVFQLQQGSWLAWAVEPLIALSIMFLALENVRGLSHRGLVSTKRLMIIFFFGLIHGLGFAGSLGALLQQGGHGLSGLIMANLGVELAQVTVLGLAWLATMKLCRSTGYVTVQKIASISIGLLAYWLLIERVLIDG
ncbi:MAG: HupE/UreJ family protein [Akkermansiaceae bacterium]